MKKSLIKITCYIVLPFLILYIISLFIYSYLKNSNYYNQEKYFESYRFISSYVQELAAQENKLIYQNANYNKIQDGETEIYYTTNQLNVYENSVNASNKKFLIIYKNKAFTNVEINGNINSIEKIKEEINKDTNGENRKYFNIINGKIESNFESMEEKARKYLGEFTFTYYTLNSESSEKLTIENKEYITVNIKDLKIYSSFDTRFQKNSNQEILSRIIEQCEKVKSHMYITMPIATILSVLIIIYLINSIGREGKDGKIQLNDIDNIPFEIVLFFDGIIIFIIWGFC